MNWQEKLTNNGYRLSEPRKQVMATLEAAEKPLTHQDIYQTLRQQHSHVGLVSVYRTLELLTGLGIVTSVFDGNGAVGFVPTSLGHHHRILCQHCHRSVEFSGSEDLTTLEARVERLTGFKVSSHLLQLFGLCPECQAAGEVQ